ncbi:MFS transporter [Streptomyces sp. NPDC058683]|uniref:MFS transporter n=1 Tax=Streptomyces sp. NPDC058683 TaxID=3346597 RepID=UPI00364B593E
MSNPLHEAVPPVERRLRATRMQMETAIAVVGCLIVLVADTQSLSLIPLLPQLEKQYGLTPSQAGWALSAVGLAGAAWAPTLTRLGDRLGMRRLLLAGLAVSLLGNLLSAVAHGFPLFLVSRALLGLSAAGPLVYAILRARSTSEQRTSRGVGILTVAIGLGIAVSYLLSGAIIQANGSVRTVLWVTTALSAVALLAAWAILPDAEARSTDPIDWVGAAGVSAGLFCIVLALGEGNTWGWSSGRIIALLAGGALIFAVWAWYEGRHAHPLINIRRVLNRTATPAFFVAGLCSALAVYTNLAQVVYLQMPRAAAGYGLSQTVLQVAYVLSAISVAVVIGGFVTGPLVTRFGPRAVVSGAAILAAAGFFFLAADHDQTWQYVVANILWGFAFAFAYGGASAAYLIDATPSEAAMYASANTVISAGIGSLGAGVFTAILTSAPTIPKTPIPQPAVFDRLFLYAGLVSLVMLGLALVMRRPRFVPADPSTDLAADMEPGAGPAPVPTA